MLEVVHLISNQSIPFQCHQGQLLASEEEHPIVLIHELRSNLQVLTRFFELQTLIMQQHLFLARQKT